MGKIFAYEVEALTCPGRYLCDPTLYLNISPAGTKSWIQRVSIRGRRHDIGLGSYPVVSLAKARKRAFANRVAIADGRDPLAEKRREHVPTFKQAAARTHEANLPRWRSSRTAKTWIQQLKLHAFPIVGEMPVNEIGREHVLRILTPVWTKRPSVARKLRGRIRQTLAWCQACGHIEHNVAGETIDAALPAQRAVREHHRALPYKEVAAALDVIAASGASLPAKACLRFVALTACRSGEARGATWDEVDIEAREWRIPAERMKTAEKHRVPLSDAALAVLESVQPLRDDAELVFPSPLRSSKPLSGMTLLKLLRETGLADRTTVHGFRTSFRTWASERTSVPHAACEMALAHRVGSDVERSYLQSDLFDKRRELMDRWAAFVTGGASAKVLPLRR